MRQRKASPLAGPHAIALGAKLPIAAVIGLQEAQEAFPGARVRATGSSHGVVIDMPYQLLRARPALREALIDASTAHGTDPLGTTWFAFAVVRANPARIAPAAVRAAAREALVLLASGRRCCTTVGIARARQLAAGRPVSDADIVKMCSYFARHAVDKRADWKRRATPGYVAWQAWGGDAGKRWACAERERLR